MNQPLSPSDAPGRGSDSGGGSGASGTDSGRRPGVGKKSIGSLILVALISVYAFARPAINQRFGWALPALNQSGGEQTSSNQPSSTSSDSKVTASSDRNDSADSDLLYGLLREVRPNYYLSPAGLQYTPGSAEGHRLRHLERHTRDITARPIHGVFDGGMEGALKTIDRAFEKAKKGTRTTKQQDGSRTIYIVDMGGRVGYQGGRDGNRRRKPMARRVKLVLDGTVVITAYPL